MPDKHRQQKNICRHSRTGGNLGSTTAKAANPNHRPNPNQIPACAGMTGQKNQTQQGRLGCKPNSHAEPKTMLGQDPSYKAEIVKTTATSSPLPLVGEG